MDNDQRKLNIAKRCQLIIGSFDGQTKCCPCRHKYECKLSESEIVNYSENPVIIEAVKCNREEFESMHIRMKDVE